jgi:hypothetical protein
MVFHDPVTEVIGIYTDVTDDVGNATSIRYMLAEELD